MSKTVAIAKHNCEVTLYVSLDSISFNKRKIKKGTKIDLPVYKDQIIKDEDIAIFLGKRNVVFREEIYLIFTTSKDFEYIEIE